MSENEANEARNDPKIVISFGDQRSPTVEEATQRIIEELTKPRFAFERTFEGCRFTKKI